MSNVFGPPPPPPSRIFEPGASTVGGANTVYDDRWYEDESPHEHRTLALFAAFVAVVFLLLANLGTWLHFDGFHPKQALVVSEATYVPATNAIISELSGARAAAAAGQNAALQGDSREAAAARAEFANAVKKASAAAVAAPAVRAAWDRAVAAGLREQQLRIDGRGEVPPNEPIVIELQTQDVTDALVTQLRAQGYVLPAAGIPTGAYAVSVNGASESTSSALGRIQDLWLLFWALAIAFGATAVAIASRPLRLSVILCVDAVLMLGLFLIALQLAVQVTDDQALEGAQPELIRDGVDALIASLESRTITLMILAGCIGIVLAVIARVRGRRRRSGAAT